MISTVGIKVLVQAGAEIAGLGLQKIACLLPLSQCSGLFARRDRESVIVRALIKSNKDKEPKQSISIRYSFHRFLAECSAYCS